MTVFKFLSMHESLLKALCANGIKVKDVEMIDMYRDAVQMASENLPKSYIVAALSDKYNVSVRSVYTTIDRFGSDIIE